MGLILQCHAFWTKECTCRLFEDCDSSFQKITPKVLHVNIFQLVTSRRMVLAQLRIEHLLDITH